MYLRAIFSPENLADPVIHLDKTSEFHVRKGTDIPQDGKPMENGGVLRGYQLTDHLFVGSIKKAQAAADEARAKSAALRNPPPDFSASIFQTGQFRFKVEYKTSDNIPHAVECRADSRDEMYQKAKFVRVRPSRVTQLDA